MRNEMDQFCTIMGYNGGYKYIEKCNILDHPTTKYIRTTHQLLDRPTKHNKQNN